MKEFSGLVVVAGYFDPLQPGHIELFNYARSMFPKSILLVLTHRLKTLLLKSRVYLWNDEERLAILKAIKGIDQVAFAEDFGDIDGTITKSLESLRPEYFVKGPDRNESNMPSSELMLCREIGCEIIYQSGAKIGASSAIKERLVKQIKTIAINV